MKLRLGFLLRVSLIILVVLALLIVYWLIWIPVNDNNLQRAGPSVNASVELLIIAVLYVSISLWIAFADKEVKSWERSLLLVGMICGLLLFLYLGLISWALSVFYFPDAAPPALLNNLSATSDFMFIIAAVLFATILGFTLIPRRKSIIEWMKNV